MTMDGTIYDLVQRYGTLKAEMDSYKKQVDQDNKDIKTIMAREGLTMIKSGDFVAKYSVIVSEDFDKEKLLSKLRTMFVDGKGMDELGVIVYEPVVSMEALEDLIYNGKINAADLADCKTRKETPRLTISKAKEK